MDVATVPKTLFGTVFVLLCATVLAGCAQFEDSFGELRSPETQPSIAGASNPAVSAGSNDHSDQRSARENGNAALANDARSFTLGGVRIELAEGQMIN